MMTGTVCRTTIGMAARLRERPVLALVLAFALTIALAVGARIGATSLPGAGGTGIGFGFGIGLGELLVVGVVGLATADDTSDLEELRRGVERLEAGAADVSFALDRDDEVGRLAAALEELADSLYDADGDGPGASFGAGSGSSAVSVSDSGSDSDSGKSERYRRKLYEITSETGVSDEEKVRRLLELGCERLDVENGLIAVVDEETGRYEVETAVGSDFVRAGTVADLSTTFCRRTVAADDVLGIYNAPADDPDDPGYREWDIGCYLGAKLTVDDELYGTLCFVDREPRDAAFTHEEKAFVDLMSRWVSHVMERRERTAQLRETTGRLSAIIEASPAAIVALDTTGRVELWNDAASEIFGWSEADVLGEPLPFVPADRTEEFERFRDRLLAGESLSDVETRRVTKDGDIIDVSLSAAPLHDADGTVAGIMGALTDISERKERERQVRERERELRQYKEYTDDILDAVDDVFYILDADGSLRRWNESHREVTGYSDAEIASMHAVDFFPEAGRDAVADAIADVLETGSGRVEAPYRTRSGETIPYEFAASRLEDPDGDPVLVGIGRDVSDRKRYERELERTTDLLQRVQRLASIGGWELDMRSDPPESTWTEELYRLHDLPHDANVDIETIVECYHPADRDRVCRTIERSLETGTGYDIEARMRTESGGTRWVRAIGDAVDEGDETVRFRGAIQDITERKAREKELERTRALLEQSQRLARVGPWQIDVEDGESVSLTLTEETLRIHDLPPGAELGLDEAIDFYHPDDRPRIRDAVETAIAEGRAYDLEARLITAEGAERWIRTIADPVRDDGEIVAVRGSIQDITERKERERDFQRTRDLLQQAQRIAEVGAWSIDVSGEPPYVPEWSDEIYDLFEVSRDRTLTSETVLEFFHPEDRGRRRAAFERAIETGEGWDHEARLVTAAGNERWVRSIGETVEENGEVVTLRGSVQDITDQKEREAELERAKELLQQAGRIAKIGGWELDLETDPPEMHWSDELYDVHDIPPDAEISLETAIEFYHPDDRGYIRDRFRRAIETGRGYDMEVRAVTESADVRWVRAIGEPVVRDGEVVRLRGSIQDITEQKERELALESLHEATRGLLGTETVDEAARIVVDAADDVLDAPGVGVYLLDSAANRLEPSAYTPSFADLSGSEPSPVAAAGDSLLWNAFVTGSQTVFDEAADPGGFGGDVDGGILVPVGDHGVFVIVTPTGSVDDATRQLVETLVATAVAAFDRLESEASLRERDAELEARNRRLERQIQITDTIRRVDRSLVDATSRDDIESTVCDRLVEGEGISFAWIGTPDPGGTKLVPRAWAGSGQEYLDALPFEGSDDPVEPAVRTARTEQPTLVENVVADVGRVEWRTRALSADFHSIVSVPLVVEDYSYGVLTVYADEPDAFGDLERTVFAELGETIANSIAAVMTQQALYADTFLELTLEFDPAEAVLGRIADEADCRVEYEGLATHSTDESRLFVATSGADASDIAAVLDGLVSVTEFRRISEDGDRCRFEVTVAGETLASRLVRHGAEPRSMIARAGELDVVVDVPTATDVREFVEMLRERYPSADLRARRDVSRETHTRDELVSSLLADLTDRQLEVLRTAYFAGFFDWPRESTGEEIAEMLGITQPTVNRHLRLAQQRLLARLFEEEAVTIVG